MHLPLALTLALAALDVDPARASADDYRRERGDALNALEGEPAPALEARRWLNTTGVAPDLDALLGKVVVVSFWGVWSPPSRAAVQRHQRLVERYGADGLVLIGVHTERGADELAAFVAKERIEFPVCVDAGDATATAYQVDAQPDAYVVDRLGRLRVADVVDEDLERVVRALLEEAGPTPPTEAGKALASLAARSVFVLEAYEEAELRETWRVELRRGEDAQGAFIEQTLEVLTVAGERNLAIARTRLSDGQLAFDSLEARSGPELREREADLSIERGKLVGALQGTRVLRNISGKVLVEPLLPLYAAALPFEPRAELPVALVRTGRRLTVAVDARLVYAGLHAPVEGAEPAHQVEVVVDRRPIRRLWFDARRRLVARVDLERPELRWVVGPPPAADAGR